MLLGGENMKSEIEKGRKYKRKCKTRERKKKKRGRKKKIRSKRVK
jgi:hypothetical protein